ncbi:hypothetical protein AAZX31_20G181000 [Glycine max]|uniref:SnoaL-like domain-containing protein n=2 Tax=Glycine subgen. Soja TaxID=1462606 RepID=C6TBE6_SOYBN|nr:uncharacterized protein LOC100812913 [Glycine max]XP_028220646.1 uncharacterized protein LOC114402327 [Glycine soja]ACU19148.1 unknown [Glycine max]KAG4908232.1 hypothetical protein JHK86_056716 [Glycine max]KAG4910872.1 hypothetical protein JHK87_056988 [Glycine soja]KAG5078186.1 hypothetical protein JHK82_056881 [Glycine max]KAH1036944.1 hypothetical protein GYH30_056386 [Glycine max]|eukprot:NP_001240236.1 uncharacterized protein LOC100812913 [Glycine max]
MATLMGKAPRILYTTQHLVNNSVTLPTNFAAMATHSAATERTYKESFDSAANKRYADHIIPHILHLYGSSATSRDFEIYAANASFEDPLMCAHGVKQIKSAFYTLPKVFKKSKIVEYSIKENMVSPGKGEILIDNKQYYKFLGKDINMVSLIKLYIEEGKVVRHEDWWDKKPISNRETAKLPLLGRIAEMTRRGSMLATHVLMRFGKDPNV